VEIDILSVESFQNIFIVLLFFSLITSALLMYYLNRKQVDVYKRSTSFWIGFAPFLLFIIIPLWLTDLPIKIKIIATAVSIAISTGNFVAIDRAQRALWKAKGIDPSKGLKQRSQDSNEFPKDQEEEKTGEK
jgi:hypothetical protein